MGPDARNQGLCDGVADLPAGATSRVANAAGSEGKTLVDTFDFGTGSVSNTTLVPREDGEVWL